MSLGFSLVPTTFLAEASARPAVTILRIVGSAYLAWLLGDRILARHMHPPRAGTSGG